MFYFLGLIVCDFDCFALLAVGLCNMSICAFPGLWFGFWVACLGCRAVFVVRSDTWLRFDFMFGFRLLHMLSLRVLLFTCVCMCFWGMCLTTLNFEFV